MIVDVEDTIAAVASAPGGALRGIVRIGGPAVLDCLSVCFRAESPGEMRAVTRPTAVAGQLTVGDDIPPVPCELYLWPSERSYTRQPVAELHLPGSPPLLAAALRTVCAAGARLAEPGEFTLRAFLAGRIDLTRAEAVLGAIDAGDDAQFQTALAQLAGGLAATLGSLRDGLLDLLSLIEAGLDFADEEIEFVSNDQIDRQLAAAAETIDRLGRQMNSRTESTDRARIVLAGRPNVGKSSLVNALAGDRVALVSDTPGTTRDYLQRRVELAGIQCVLVDTAGSAAGADDDALHAETQRMADRQRRRAHVQLLCIDSTRPIDDWEKAELARDALPARLIVLTKCDRPCRTDCAAPAIRTSARTGLGLSDLRNRIGALLTAGPAQEAGVVAATAVRCRESLRLARESLDRARRVAAEDAAEFTGEELIAAEMRVALDELGKVVGTVYTDDVLDRIFGRFCIGK